MDPLTRFGALGGGLLTAVGALGFAVTGTSEPLTTPGQHLLVLEVNPAQNLLHLVLGLAMVVGTARSRDGARTTALVASAALGMLGLVGLILTNPTNPLALDAWGNLLHLALATWGAVAVGRASSDAADVETPRSWTRAR